MRLEPHQLYHIYNQGNNRERIFFSQSNYVFFLHKVRKYIAPHCRILAYCLMPNHFHFLIDTSEASVKMIQQGSVTLTQLAQGFSVLQSSYAKAINKQKDRSGSLFRSKVQAKCLTNPEKPDTSGIYPFVCFHYIHQNPWKARLVKRMEDWEFSSFHDYAGLRKGTLCDQQRAETLLGFCRDTFYEDAYQILNPQMVSALF